MSTRLRAVLLTISLLGALLAPVGAASAGTTVTTANINFAGRSGHIASVSVGSGISATGPIAGSVAVAGVNPTLAGNQAMIFDSTCGGKQKDCTGNDQDLYSPALGNTLIVSEDGDASNPDDADVRGSTLVFNFANFGPGVVDIISVTVLDVEDRQGEDANFTATRAGTKVAERLKIITSDNEAQVFDLPGANAVDRLVVELNGSGAIGNIKLRVTETTTPPEVSITKAATPASGATVVVGDEVTYKLTVTNNGQDTATDIAVRDSLSGNARLTGVVSGCDSTPVLTNKQMDCTIDSLAGGASRTIVLTGRVTDPGSAQRCSIANVSSTSFADGNSSNNTSNTVRHIVDCTEPEVGIVKTANPASGTAVAEGDTITYTLRVTNNGDAVATDVSVADRLSGDARLLTATGCDTTPVLTSQTMDCSLDSMGPGTSRDITVTATATAPNNATCVINNVASINFDDANSANNTSATVTNPRSCRPPPEPEVSIAKSASPVHGSTVEGGQTVTYTLAVTNTGQAAAKNVGVRDVLTGSGVITSITGCVAPSLTPREANCTIAEIAPGTTVNVTVVVKVADEPAVGACLSNIASTTFDDDNQGNNTSNTVAHACSSSADLTITKTSDVAPGQSVALGDVITYTLTATNNGTGDAASATVRDTLTGAAQIVDVRGCDTDPVVTSRTLACEVLDVLAGTSRTITVTVEILSPGSSDGCDPVANVASVKADGDKNPGNDVSNTVTALRDCSLDLAIVKSAEPAPVFEGVDFTFISGEFGTEFNIDYTLAVTNLSSVDAFDVAVTDTLVGEVSVVAGEDPMTGCDDDVITSSKVVTGLFETTQATLTCSIPVVRAGETVNIGVSVLVTDAATDLGDCVTNVASIEHPEDVNVENNTSERVQHTCDIKTFAAQVEISKVASPASGTTLSDAVISGGLFYTLVVTNPLNFDDLVDIVVTDTLTVTGDSGFTSVVALGTPVGCDSISSSTGRGFECVIDSMANGTSREITVPLIFSATGSLACGSVTNIADVTAVSAEASGGTTGSRAQNVVHERPALTYCLTGFTGGPLAVLATMLVLGGTGLLISRRRDELDFEIG